MNSSTTYPRHFLAMAILALSSMMCWAASVHFEDLPDDGIQPQVEVDAGGDVHVLYFKGDAAGGDVYYTKRPAMSAKFQPSVRVNHQEGGVIAAGTIRGAHLALGKHGRPHVVWNGSSRTHEGDHMTAPLLYTAMKEDGSGFKKERNVITYAYGLDGGSSIAADAQGRVHVVWHASPPGNTEGESGRAVFMASSNDGGRTFARERVISPEGTGACGCCGLKAHADDQGNTYVLYRGARGGSERGVILLESSPTEAAFRVVRTHPWKLTACPMSSAFIGQSPTGVLAAWETKQQIYFSTVSTKDESSSSPWSPPGDASRKHPATARNAAGETLLVWVEDSGWKREGRLAWQVFDPQGHPVAEPRREGKLPVWSFASCYARPDGSFVILR